MASALADRFSARSKALVPGLRRQMMTADQGMSDVIALARGDPDFDTPSHIVAAGQQALSEGRTHYTPWNGIPELRVEIANKLERENRITTDATTQIIVTGGAQEALYLTVQMLIDQGDEVLLPDPCYSAYNDAIRMAGGQIVDVPTIGEDRFEIRAAEFERRITNRTKLLVLVDPSNPAGAVLSPEQVHQVADVAIRHDLAVLSDEVYEKQIFDGFEHTSVASIPGMNDRTVSIFSFSKTYAMTGWRIGYLTAPADFVDRASELHYVISICASAPAQAAALAALRGPQHQVAEMTASYAMRRDFLVDGLERLGLPCVVPRAGLSVMADIRGTRMTSVEFCVHLLDTAAVKVFPGAMYGASAEGYVRVSLLAPLPQLEEALRRIRSALPAAT